MARIRTVKPQTFKNETLAELPISARYLFIGLFCLADREGRLEDRPRRIKAEIYPYENIDVEPLLTRLQSAGFIDRYEVGELKVIQVVNFTKHQRISGSEAKTISEYPPNPCAKKGSTKEDTWNTQGRQERSIRKGVIGKERIEEDLSVHSPPSDEGLIFDIEDFIKKNQTRFEEICMKTSRSPDLAWEVLRKYHLWNVEKGNYPKPKRSLMAGFEKWLMNEKVNNGKNIAEPVSGNRRTAGLTALLEEGKQRFNSGGNNTG